jgi:tryptophan synthase alpha chain
VSEGLEARLRATRDAGGKAFVPYVTGGFPGVDAELLRSIEAAGADAVEVGIPHSDPIMDGGVIQEASRIALEEAHAHPSDVLATIAEAALSIPVVVMTYANILYRKGFDDSLDQLRDAGVAGVILPDLPVDEAADFDAAAADRGIANVLLAAPGTAPERLARIGAEAHGYVYCVATYGVTGARERLSDTARQVVDSLRPHTDLPLLVGVGIATPEQAAEACGFADGVIVGSALMGPMVEGDPDRMLSLTAAFRDAVPTA